MKKFINDPKDFVTEMLNGLYIAHSDLITYTNNDLRCLVISNPKKGKVGIATGGGSGHLPLFLGYVGKGMLDGCSVGDVFQSPSSEQVLAVTKYIDSGAGVLYIYGNYNGDIFNFDMAAEMADFEENIRVESVVCGEDVASAKPSKPGAKNTRRGVAGIFFVFKTAGAVAEAMKDLDEVKRIAEKTAANVRTMGVALSPCIVPRVGRPGFEIGDNQMEIGIGIHGESGIRRGEIEQADKVVDELLNQIVQDLPYREGDEVAVLVNGLGSTPLEEQYIVVRRIQEYLNKLKIQVHRYYVGEYATALEMVGFSISLLKLDDELKSYLDAPARTPLFIQS